jgi:ATP-dependent DNA ligase
MLLLRTERLPEGPDWLYELKLDGYRAIGAKPAGRAHPWSRNEKDFGPGFPNIANALANLPDNSVVDGEIVALDESGKPSFSALQTTVRRRLGVHITSSICSCWPAGTCAERLDRRKQLLEQIILPVERFRSVLT